MWWKIRKDKARQNQRRRPSLQIPLPPPEYYDRDELKSERDDRDEPTRGHVKIDYTL